MNELTSILSYWSSNTIDNYNGGFIGQIDHLNVKNYFADKGAVMNARILWAFSAAYKITAAQNDFDMAERAYNYIVKYFYDDEFGGIFWSIDYTGAPKDTKNQIYAIAFVIYGLTEYYTICKNKDALEKAIQLFYKIEEHSRDRGNHGYFEAFGRDWKPIHDLRLSDKDANEKKTMNTHLHIAEAYANLYLVWPDEALRLCIINILNVIDTYFIDKYDWHLKLFFDENWVEKPDVISYGHDIEAAWLLLWCAEAIEDVSLTEKYSKYAIEMAKVTKEGIDTDGGLWYEFDPTGNGLIAEKHSWPQAELWVGMINAWQLTNDIEYFKIVMKNFDFVQKHLKDTENGEWRWGIYDDYTEIEKDRAGFWKCPYHNSRACIELIKRLNN